MTDPSNDMMPAITDQEVEEKEMVLREKIARNVGRIHDYERELAEMQLELRMNIGPKKQAMELIRKKIEHQNVRVSEARQRMISAKKAYEEAEKVFGIEDAQKNQLCDELSLLVQQANRSQMDKLEQLASRLEMLNTGIPAASNGTAAVVQQQQPQPQASNQAPTSSTTPPIITSPTEQHQPTKEEMYKAQIESEAAAARTRHVSLNSSRGHRPTASVLHATKAPPPAAPVRDAGTGAFRGFE